MIGRTSTRILLPCLAGGLALAALAAGKVSVTGGTSSAQTALKNVQSSAQKFDSESKGAFSSQTTALRSALAGLQTDLKSLRGFPSATQLKALVAQGGKVKTAAASLQGAWSAKCS